MGNPKFAIICEDESALVLSNQRTSDIWNSLEDLVKVLLRDSNFADESVLSAWKEKGHRAAAKEPYAWRAVLEEIKNSDLASKCSDYRGREEFVLMTDKPTMLKIAGEITSGLLHSYSSRHRISFVQSVSNVPS
jgi:hypothetical protein